MTRDELINAIDSPIVQALARVFDTPPQRMDKSFSEQIVEILAPKLINVRAQCALPAELASFGIDRKRLWILKFEDADRGDMHFDDESDAHHAYENFSVGWNCTLLETSDRKFEVRCGMLTALSSTERCPPGHELCSSCGRLFKFGDTCQRGGCPCGGDV